MKKTFLLPIMTLALLAGTVAGCGGSDNKKKAAEAKEQWNLSLEDSIRNIQTEIDSSQNNLDILHDNVGVWLRDFTHIDNSREVEGYTIFNGWQKRYPLTSTGIVARISESEGLEIIAALKGGNFTSIKVVGPETSVTSDVVPHDQALNYRANGLNTVLFTGPKADSIARLIADNELNNLTLFFLSSGEEGKWAIPEANKRMISATWQLYSTQKEAERLERRIPLLNEKIRILRATIDKNRKNHK